MAARFDAFSIGARQSAYKDVKRLAVGLTTNNPDDHDDTMKEVQDNSYWYGYGQLEYNKEIWIPPANQMFRQRGLWVASNARFSDTDTGLRTFSFGELVALCGNDRRTTSCQEGRCSLTDADFSTLSFTKGQDCFGIGPFEECGYRPSPMAIESYLRDISSGLVLPFGSAGHVTSNTAGDVEYGEAGWWGDEMLRIANTNNWHFSNAAVAWYVGVHRLALWHASMARSNPRYWNDALHFEANALHSLTDLFACGHIVASRAETSHRIVADPQSDLLYESAYRWMQYVTGRGGGLNDGDGRVELSLPLPEHAGHIFQVRETTFFPPIVGLLPSPVAPTRIANTITRSMPAARSSGTSPAIGFASTATATSNCEPTSPSTRRPWRSSPKRSGSLSSPF